MNREEQKFALVVEKIAPRSRLLRAWTLNGGISAAMTALEIRRPDGQTQKLVVRRPNEGALHHNPRAAELEYQVLQLAQTLGFAVPKPLALDSSGEIFSTPYLVTGYIEGSVDFSPAHPDDYAAQMAGCLAQIHGIDGARTDLSFVPRQPVELTGVVGSSSPRPTDTLEEGRVRGALERAWPALRRNPPTLLHGDFWPGNILWQGDRLAAVLDWEDACTGEPLSDLAIARLDLLWIIGRDAMEAFTQHYLSTKTLDAASLPVWDLWAALRLGRVAGGDLAGWAAFFHPYGRTDITGDSFREHFRFFVSQALQRLSTP